MSEEPKNADGRFDVQIASLNDPGGESQSSSLDGGFLDTATEYPEGGLQAWLAVLGGFMVLFCTFGTTMSFGVYQDYYTRISLNERSASQISWIGSLQESLVFLLGIVSGRLFDAGYVRSMMICGSSIYIISVFLLSLVPPHHYYQNFLAQGLASGLGMGLITVPAMAIASQYFNKRRAHATGIIVAGGGIGGAIYPIMLNHLFQSRAGFAWGVRASGFLDLAILSVATLIMRPRVIGLPTLNQKRSPFMNIVRDVGYCTSVCGAFFVFLGFYIPYFYLQLYGNLHGVTSNVSFYSISIMNISSAIGRWGLCFLADLLGPLNLIIPSTAILGALIFAMFAAATPAGMVLFAIFYGIFAGLYSSVIQNVAASFACDIGEVGTRIGVLMCVSGLAALIGSPIAGALLSPPQYLWWRPIVFASVSVLFGCVLHFVSRLFMVKRKGTNRV